MKTKLVSWSLLTLLLGWVVLGIFEVGGERKTYQVGSWEKEKWGLKLDVTKFSDEKRRG